MAILLQVQEIAEVIQYLALLLLLAGVVEVIGTAIRQVLMAGPEEEERAPILWAGEPLEVVTPP